MTTEINVAAQAGDEPMRAALSVKPSEWSADTPLNAIIDGDAIAKSRRIMCLIDNYTEAMDSPINQHPRDARTAIRCALMAEFEAAQVSPRATADVERVELEDIAALVVRLARKLEKEFPGTDLVPQAFDYLTRKGLSGSPLRATTKPGA
jgi:hypothetical protein